VRNVLQRIIAAAISPYWLRQLAFAIAMPITVFLIVPLWALIHDPMPVVRDWQFFVPFIVLPYSLAIALLVLTTLRSRMTNRSRSR